MKACGMRKVNEMVKRIRLAIVNVCVLGHLRSKMPYFFGKEAIQRDLIENLAEVFSIVRSKYDLADGDFPKLNEFKAALRLADFSTFPHTNREVLVSLQDMLTVDIPRIIAHVAGVVKEGPGTSTVDSDDEADISQSGNKLPRLFTIPEINSSAVSIAMIAGLGLFLIIALLVVVYVLVFNKNVLEQLKGTEL